MNARDRGVSTETRTGLDAEGPLRRWARRRREVAREEEEAAAAEARRRKTSRELPREPSRKAPHEAPDVRDPDAGASDPGASAAAEAEKVLTDEDMPPLDSLGEDSDYSGFLSPGVSEALRRRALRKLFLSAAFNVPDGLDDYDEDFTSFQALGDIVTSDMKHQAEMEAERAKLARAEAEPASGPRDEPARDEPDGDEPGGDGPGGDESSGDEGAAAGPGATDGVAARSSTSEPTAGGEEAPRSSRLADGGTPSVPAGASAPVGADAPGHAGDSSLG